MSTLSPGSEAESEDVDVGRRMERFHSLQHQIQARLNTFETYFKLFEWEELADECYGDVRKECEELMSTLRREFESPNPNPNVAGIVTERVTEAMRRIDESCESLKKLKTERYPPLAIPDRVTRSGEPLKVHFFDLPQVRLVKCGVLPYRSVHFATAHHQGKLYVVGGAHEGKWLDTMSIYDPVENVRSEGARMRVGRTRTSSGFHRGKLFVAGGYCGRCLNSVECYDPDSRKWADCPNLNVARADAAVVSLDGQLFVLGGYNGNDYEKSIEMLNEQTQRFELVGRMEDGRAGFGACVFRGRIHVAGGWKGPQDTLDTVESYDPKEKTWRAEPSMSRSRKYFTLHAGHKTIFAIGGCSDAWQQIREIERLDDGASEWRVCWKKEIPTLGSSS